jgi:hypothetical protein
MNTVSFRALTPNLDPKLRFGITTRVSIADEPLPDPEADEWVSKTMKSLATGQLREGDEEIENAQPHFKTALREAIRAQNQMGEAWVITKDYADRLLRRL